MRRVASLRKFGRELLAMGYRPSLAFAMTCLLLVTAFTLGGSSRGDVPALLFLRPAATVMLGYGLWTLRPAHIAAHRFLFGFAIAALAIPLLHLVRVPEMLWAGMPGHGLLAEIDRSAGFAKAWRPLSIAPEATRNALLSELVPLAVLVLGAQLSERELQLLSPVLLGMGVISATLAVMQTVSGADIPQPLYSTSTDGSAVGLFANRNHQALFLATMFPMLANLAADVRPASSSADGRMPRMILIPLLAAACALCLMPLLLITGSRAGLALGLTAILTMPLFFLRKPSRTVWILRSRSSANAPGLRLWATRPRRALLVASSLLLIVGIVWAVLATAYASGRTEAFDRFRSSSIVDDMRFRALPTIWSMLGHYWPLGSGAGTFEKAYFVAEPDSLLGAVYMNHAHNDWLEVGVTTGIAGVCLLVAAILAFAVRSYRIVKARLETPANISKSTQFVLLGLVVILLCALASLGDYPLRVPSLACVFVVAALWADGPLARQRTGTVALDDN
jgi:O-antigen ligase